MLEDISTTEPQKIKKYGEKIHTKKIKQNT
jgi:hypothetical protein